MADLEKLLAIEEIKALKARYFRCMDTKDWAGLRDVFTADAKIDPSESMTARNDKGEMVSMDGLPQPAPDRSMIADGADAFLKMLVPMLTGVSTVHHGHMPEIEILSADEARGVWAMEDMLRWPEGAPLRALHGFGHYHETYRRERGGWKISALKLTRVRVDIVS